MPCYYDLPDDMIDVISKIAHQLSYRETLEHLVSDRGHNLRVTVSWQPIFSNIND